MALENECTPSTTWTWRTVKVKRRPQGTNTARRSRSSGPRLPKVDPRDAHSIRVTYRGGAEAWWKLEARGRVYIAPGHLALHDALMFIMDGNPGVSQGRQ